jgi:hypothetical protein
VGGRFRGSRWGRRTENVPCTTYKILTDSQNARHIFTACSAPPPVAFPENYFPLSRHSCDNGPSGKCDVRLVNASHTRKQDTKVRVPVTLRYFGSRYRAVWFAGINVILTMTCSLQMVGREEC